jgi:hypothetical protein
LYVTGAFHPPADVDSLLVLSNNLPWTFLLAPVLAGAPLLTAFVTSGTDGSAGGRGHKRWLQGHSASHAARFQAKRGRGRSETRIETGR